MAFQGNAFALLDGEDGENLLARVSTSAVKESIPPAAVDKQGGNQKKPMPASNSSLQTSSAPQRSSDHEKGRYSRNGNNKQNGNALENHSRNNIKSYNRDGGNRYNKNDGHDNGFQQNNGGTFSKRNNGRPFDGFKRSEGISNGYQKKVEATDGHQKNVNATNGNSNGQQKIQEAGEINGYQKKDNEANGNSNGSQKKQGEEEAEEGWQIVVGKSNGHKQRNAHHRSASRESNYGLRRVSSNGNGNVNEVLENQHSEEIGENRVSGDTRDVTGYRVNDKLEWNGNVNGPSVDGAGEENEKTSESKELLKEEGLEDDGTSSKGHDKVTSKEELEQLEYEKKKQAEWEAKKLEQKLEAKKMTLKQYEKQLEEKRKALDSLKTEERKVTLDKDFDSMQVIGKKNEEAANFIQLNSTSDKQKKKGATNKEDSNSQKVKKIVLSPPPSAGRGGRNPRREDDRNGDRSVLEGSRKVPDYHRSVEKAARLPPSFKDDEQFPALG